MAIQTDNFCANPADREQQLRDIATSGNEAAECAASDAFKEFPAEEDK